MSSSKYNGVEGGRRGSSKKRKSLPAHLRVSDSKETPPSLSPFGTPLALSEDCELSDSQLRDLKKASLLEQSCSTAASDESDDSSDDELKGDDCDSVPVKQKKRVVRRKVKKAQRPTTPGPMGRRTRSIKRRASAMSSATPRATSASGGRKGVAQKRRSLATSSGGAFTFGEEPPSVLTTSASLSSCRLPGMAVAMTSSSGAVVRKLKAENQTLSLRVSALEIRCKKLDTCRRELSIKLSRVEEREASKRKAASKEKGMRIKANQEKYLMQQILASMQKAIQSRLKLLGIDFSDCSNIGEALDMSLRAIRSLMAQLEAKEKLIVKLQKAAKRDFESINELQEDLASTKQMLKWLTEKQEFQKKQIAEKDAETKALRKELKKASERVDTLERENKKMAHDLTAKTHTFESASQSLSLLEEENSRHSATLKQKTGRIEDLESELMLLKEDLTERHGAVGEMAAALHSKTELMCGLRSELSSTEQKLAETTKTCEKTTVERDCLRKEVADNLNTIERLKVECAAECQRNEELEAVVKDKSSKLSSANDKVKSLSSAVASMKQTLSQASERIMDMEATIAEKNAAIAKLQFEKQNWRQLLSTANAYIQQLIRMSLALSRSVAELSKKASTCVDLSQRVEELSNEVKSLRAHIEKVEARNGELEADNKKLSDDVQELVKSAAMFMVDTSNHSGELRALKAAPNRGIVATTATDRSVRLWQCSEATTRTGDGAAKVKCTPYARANFRGQALCLAWNASGEWLAAGASYMSSPDGFVLVWDIADVGVAECRCRTALRSKPSLRFGEVNAICFGPESAANLLFAGDKTGAVWVFNLSNENLIGKIESHTDIVYDLGIGTDMLLYSVSHDKTLACFDASTIDRSVEVRAFISMSEVMRKEITKKKAPARLRRSRSGSIGTAVSRSASTGRKSRRSVSKGKSTSARKRRSLSTKKKPSTPRSAMELAVVMPEIGPLSDGKTVDEMPIYYGHECFSDGSYALWKVCVSEEGSHVVVGSRRVSRVKPEVKGIVDGESDHVNSLSVKNGVLAVTRQNVGCVKLFRVMDGGTVAKFDSRKKTPMKGADFLFDGRSVVTASQDAKGQLKPVLQVFSYR